MTDNDEKMTQTAPTMTSQTAPTMTSLLKMAAAHAQVPEDVLRGGNFHRGFAARLLWWYAFDEMSLGSALMYSFLFGVWVTCIVAVFEGSYKRRAMRSQSFAPLVSAVLHPFRMFGVFDIPVWHVPCWVPTSFSHSIPLSTFAHFETIRPYLA